VQSACAIVSYCARACLPKPAQRQPTMAHYFLLLGLHYVR
jgi:hypothetical protein